MKKLTAALVVAAALICSTTVAGAAAPADRAGTADAAASWLLGRVDPGGYLISPYTGNPDLGSTAQAVIGLAGLQVGKTQVDAMIAYLQAHVDAYVDPAGASGTDAPGALAWLILDAVATGADPHAFGGSDLVARLQATQRPDGLFGLADQDPTYDGATRQGLALLALHAVGVTNANGLTWLEDQQCDDGSFVAYRSDTSVACPPVDALAYSGSDTNSTSFAAMGLKASGATTEATDAVGWLLGVRAADGGFPYYGDPTQPSDGNSTGVTLAALTTVTGTIDDDAVSALAALQSTCDADPADIGGIAFQPADGTVVPDQMATVQALLGLTGVALPVTAPNVWKDVVSKCGDEIPPTTPPVTTPTTLVTVAPTTSGSATPVANSTGAATLPATGGGIGGLGDGELALLGVLLVAAGTLALAAERRRHMGA